MPSGKTHIYLLIACLFATLACSQGSTTRPETVSPAKKTDDAKKDDAEKKVDESKPEDAKTADTGQKLAPEQKVQAYSSPINSAGPSSAQKFALANLECEKENIECRVELQKDGLMQVSTTEKVYNGCNQLLSTHSFKKLIAPDGTVKRDEGSIADSVPAGCPDPGEEASINIATATNSSESSANAVLATLKNNGIDTQLADDFNNNINVSNFSGDQAAGYSMELSYPADSSMPIASMYLVNTNDGNTFSAPLSNAEHQSSDDKTMLLNARWSTENFVPIDQFNSSDWHIVLMNSDNQIHAINSESER